MAKINYVVNLVSKRFVSGTLAPTKVRVNCTKADGSPVGSTQETPLNGTPIAGQFDDEGTADTYTVTAQAVNDAGTNTGDPFSATITDGGDVNYSVPGAITLSLS